MVIKLVLVFREIEVDYLLGDEEGLVLVIVLFGDNLFFYRDKKCVLMEVFLKDIINGVLCVMEGI